MTDVEIIEPEGQPRLRERQTDAWHRDLSDGRMEVMAKTPGVRLRVMGSEEQCWEAIEMFERWTGRQVHSARRPRRSIPVAPGQLAMTELESADV